MSARGNDENGPRPEELAAYVDGELSPADRAEVEAWLADHPEAATEVEALRGLSQLWQTAAPPEPTEAQWAGVFSHIKAALPAAVAPSLRWRRGLAWGLAALATAAAVLLAVFLTRPTEVGPPPPEPFPVVTPDEFEINQINAEDAGALLVGDIPVREQLALLGPGEVTVESVKSDVEGMDPTFPRDGSATPMIIMVPREEGP
jgi:anti-sigma-K factor RskA